MHSRVRSNLTETALQPARSDDLDAVNALIESVGLPTAGIADCFPEGYCVVRRGRQIIAVAGLEARGLSGLLRSVAVAAGERGSGMGRALVEDRIGAARARRLVAVYLLTTTAAEYFRRLGFRDARREEVPAEIRTSVEFTAVCPSTATCLARELR